MFGGSSLSVLVSWSSPFSDICAFWVSVVFRVSRLTPGEREPWPIRWLPFDRGFRVSSDFS